MINLPVNEAPNLIILVEGTGLHHELPFHDPASLRERIETLIEKLRNSLTALDTDVNTLEETIECLDAARDELDALSDGRLLKVVETCIGNSLQPEIKKFIAEKRSRALTTIIQANIGLGF